MERNLNNEDFEEFLKLKTDHYKLYPSEKVWKGVYQSLHTRKRWLKVGGGLLFLTTVLFVSYQFNGKQATPKAGQSQQASTLPKTNNLAQPANKSQLPSIIAPVTQATTNFPNNFPVKKNDNSLTISGDVDLSTPSLTVGEYAEPASSTFTVENETTTTPGDAFVNTTSEAPAIAAGESETTGNPPVAIEADERTVHVGNEINWLQEMATLRLTSVKKHRFNLQFYFSPTISYRELTDGAKAKGLSNMPLARDEEGINSFVDHKPAIGLEIGSNLLFSPSKKLTLKSGLQLNYSRYNIKAYKFYFEKANIALLSSGPGKDTMSAYTSIRNFNGYFPEQLQNQYLQLSLPIGAELKVLGNKRLQLSVAGTVQPSYLLYHDAYLLSSDFINYIKEPSLIRRWNVNTSAEAFVSYYMGGMRWQVGPQLRYQTLSTYNDRYPIKEYLIEYGFKIGVSKTLK